MIQNDIFKALADPTRRFLLDLLFARDGRTLTELESELDMTRFGVSKHLKVLEEAGLVVTRRQGREKLHFLNAVPIRLIHDRWIDKYTERQVSALADLKAELEERTEMNATTTATTVQVHRVHIRATPEAIWDAITKPEFTQRYFYGTAIDSPFEVGTPYVSRTADGEHVMVEGEIVESDPPRRLVHTWLALYEESMAKEQPSRVAWEIEAQEDGVCLLTVVHDRLEGAPATAASVAGGWMYVLSGLKTLLETGEPLR